MLVNTRREVENGAPSDERIANGSTEGQHRAYGRNEYHVCHASVPVEVATV